MRIDGFLDLRPRAIIYYAMPLYIANSEADELARELASVTGESITDAVIQSLRERRDRLRRPTVQERIERMRSIAEHSASIIRGRRVDVDDMYDDHGAPR